MWALLAGAAVCTVLPGSTCDLRTGTLHPCKVALRWGLFLSIFGSWFWCLHLRKGYGDNTESWLCGCKFVLKLYLLFIIYLFIYLVSFLQDDLVFGWFLFSFLGVWISFSLNSKSFTVKADYCGLLSTVATWP